MYNIPIPYVMDQLKFDLLDYGMCRFTVTDNPSEFSIKRLYPFANRGYVVYE